MQGKLDKLIEFITQHYPFPKDVFPSLEGKTEEEKFIFAVRHVAMHFAKTAGKVVAVSEDADHTNKVDTEVLKDEIPKALINVLRLAALAGMSEKEIIQSIAEKYNDSFKAE